VDVCERRRIGAALVKTFSSLITLVVVSPSFNRLMRNLRITTSFLTPRRKEALCINFNHRPAGASFRDPHPNLTVFRGWDAKQGEAFQLDPCFQMENVFIRFEISVLAIDEAVTPGAAPQLLVDTACCRDGDAGRTSCRRQRRTLRRIPWCWHRRYGAATRRALAPSALLHERRIQGT
jgi:hypothetical protein